MTTTSDAVAGEATSNSTPPAVFGAAKVETTMLSSASDSLGESERVCGAAAGHGPMKQR